MINKVTFQTPISTNENSFKPWDSGFNFAFSLKGHTGETLDESIGVIDLIHVRKYKDPVTNEKKEKETIIPFTNCAPERLFSNSD